MYWAGSSQKPWIPHDPWTEVTKAHGWPPFPVGASHIYTDSQLYPCRLACHLVLLGQPTIFSNSPNANSIPHCHPCKPNPLRIPVTELHTALVSPSPAPSSFTFRRGHLRLFPHYTGMPCSCSMFKLGSHRWTFTGGRRKGPPCQTVKAT